MTRGVYRRGIKRALDLVLAVVGLVLLLPVFAIVALLIQRNLGSPVLFRQQRPGLNGRPFTMLKFRTMRNGVGEDGTLLTDSERLTGFGRTLRSTSIDEIPELWNVIRGDMSLVGPRPLLEEYVPRYSPEQARRHEVRPGITGWAQIHGRNAISWTEKFELDVWYVDHVSLATDVKIMWKTFATTLGRRGVYAPEGGTVPPFTG